MGIDPLLVMNIPSYCDPGSPRPIDPNHIRLVNHGSAVRDRQLETMIEAVALADERFSLDFYLFEVEAGYIDKLKALAERLRLTAFTFILPSRTAKSSAR